jgi:hypothetical protein
MISDHIDSSRDMDTGTNSSTILNEGEYSRGDVHTNNCECRTNLYKLWMSKFMGVNKKNLETYIFEDVPVRDAINQGWTKSQEKRGS